MAGRERFSPTPADRTKLVQLPPSADDLPERTVIDLNSKTPAIPIAIVDDTPEDDRGRPTELDYSLADQEEDLRDISGRTKKRIERLKFETHTERRAREAAERERDAAVQLATQQRDELERLRRGAETGATALANSMKAEREARLADAKRRLAAAHADGDAEAIATATADISIATSELTQIAARTPAPRTEQQREQPAAQPQRQAPNLAPNVVGLNAPGLGLQLLRRSLLTQVADSLKASLLGLDGGCLCQGVSLTDQVTLSGSAEDARGIKPQAQHTTSHSHTNAVAT